MSDIQVTSVDGSQINVSTGTVIGPLPSLQLAAGSGINIANAGGVSTISANLAELSIPANLADLSDVSTSSLELGQALTWNGTQWTGANIPVGTTLNGESGALSLVGGSGISVNTVDNVLTVSANVSAADRTAVNGLSGNIALLSGIGITVSEDGQNISVDVSDDIEYAISSQDDTLRVLRDEELRSTTIEVNWPTTPFGVAAIPGVSGDATVIWQEPIPRALDYVIEYEKVEPLSAPQITSASIAGGDLTIDVDFQDTPLEQVVIAQFSTDGGTTWSDV